jgi:hypothetical protein
VVRRSLGPQVSTLTLPMSTALTPTMQRPGSTSVANSPTATWSPIVTVTSSTITLVLSSIATLSFTSAPKSIVIPRPATLVEILINPFASEETAAGMNVLASIRHTRAAWIKTQRGKPSLPIKIDQAYSVGGFDLMRRTVEDATGLSIDFQTVFQDSMLINLVDDVLANVEIDNPAD